MAVNATLTVTPSAPAHGATVTATYAVTGNTGSPAQVGSVVGQVTIGGVVYDLNAPLTAPAVAPLPESYATPTFPGLTFVATADPHVFTAVVP